jgi:hypothetical protein
VWTQFSGTNFALSEFILVPGSIVELIDEVNPPFKLSSPYPNQNHSSVQQNQKSFNHFNKVSAQLFLKLIRVKKPKELYCFKTIQKLFALCFSYLSHQTLLIFVLLICLSVFLVFFSFI